MGNIVGIDLGTTNSVAAFKFAEVQVVTVEGNTGSESKLIRSVVASSQGKLIVGKDAYNQGDNIISSIKRLMGRGFADPVIQQQLSHFSYDITQSSQGTENSLSVWLNGKEYEPEDISAEILKKVISNAQAWLQQNGQTSKITEAVITVPAYFNDKQRYATQNAAKRAGLIVKELLAEPTAAAISYGFKADSDDVKTILVYDFGGGTFDSSVITASGNYFAELGKAGDLWLGGDDIDSKIAELVKQKVAEEEGLNNLDDIISKMPQNPRVRFLRDLKVAVERAKIDLSSRSEANINILSSYLLDEFGSVIPIDVTITRTEFEPMILPLIERSIAICKDAIKESNYEEEMIDVVLLVGGSSQIPIVQQKLKEAFGEHRVVVHPRPMYAVAEGAAIVAAGLTEKTSTVSRDYCIQLVDDPRFILIKRGADLPVQKSHIFKTEADGQRLIHFKFFSPDEIRKDLDHTYNDEAIGQAWMALDKYYPKGTEVCLWIEIDENNEAAKVTAALKNDESIKVSCSFSRGRMDETISKEVECLIRELNEEGSLTQIGVEQANELAGQVVNASNQIMGEDGKIKIDQKEKAESKLKELRMFASDDYHSALFFIREFNFAINQCGDLIPQVQKERIEKLIKSLENFVEDNNKSSEKLLEDARQEYKNLPDLVQLLLMCKAGIGQANRVNPTAANAMANQFEHILYAIQKGDMNEADRILREFLPEVDKYLDQKLPTGTIATGLTK